MRSLSAQRTLQQGLAYRFQLSDLNKYSQKLNLKDVNWKIKMSALGKCIPTVEKRKKILVKGSHLGTLLRLFHGHFKRVELRKAWSSAGVDDTFLQGIQFLVTNKITA